MSVPWGASREGRGVWAETLEWGSSRAIFTVEQQHAAAVPESEGLSRRGGKCSFRILPKSFFAFSSCLLDRLMLAACVRLSWGGPGEDTQWGGEPVATGLLYCWEGDGAERGPVHTANAACRLYASASLCSWPGPSLSWPGLSYFFFIGSTITPQLRMDFSQRITILGFWDTYMSLKGKSFMCFQWKRGTNFPMRFLCSFWGSHFFLRGGLKRITRCMPSQTICWISKNWMPSWKKLHIQCLWKGNFIWLGTGRVRKIVFSGILAKRL